jgi:spore germination cell wall hydrolase CwlJ-like protein
VPVKLASTDTNALDTVPATPAPKLDLQHARLQSPARLLNLSAQSLVKAKHCLARAIYFEARAEPVRGQIAVAQVVINRVFSGFYPGDLCDVVYQNAGRHLDCQFTFACDGKSKVIHERGAWARAEQIATQVLAGDLYDPAVGTSTHYHALYVHPDWVPEMKKFVRRGTHNFYRPVAWGSGEDAPVWGIVPLPPNRDKPE